MISDQHLYDYSEYVGVISWLGPHTRRIPTTIPIAVHGFKTLITFHKLALMYTMSFLTLIYFFANYVQCRITVIASTNDAEMLFPRGNLSVMQLVQIKTARILPEV